MLELDASSSSEGGSADEEAELSSEECDVFPASQSGEQLREDLKRNTNN